MIEPGQWFWEITSQQWFIVTDHFERKQVVHIVSADSGLPLMIQKIDGNWRRVVPRISGVFDVCSVEHGDFVFLGDAGPEDSCFRSANSWRN